MEIEDKSCSKSHGFPPQCAVAKDAKVISTSIAAFCYTRCRWRSFLSFHKHNSELLALDPVFN